MGNFTELDAYLFGQGTHYDIYKKLGAHLSVDGKKRCAVCCLAPNAKRVFVIGEFNGWDETANEMERRTGEYRCVRDVRSEYRKRAFSTNI